LPRTEQRLEDQEEPMRAAVRHDDVVDLAANVVFARELRDQRLAQGPDAALIGIMRLAATGRLTQRLDDVRCRVEIGLSALEMMDGLPRELARSRGGHDLAELGSHSQDGAIGEQDRKSTRVNSSHVSISYAVFCLK